MALDNTRKARVALAAVAVQAAVAAVTIRDINHRPKEAVRGPKMLWRVVGGANTLGSVAYWLIGRKRRVGSGKAVLVSQEG